MSTHSDLKVVWVEEEQCKLCNMLQKTSKLLMPCREMGPPPVRRKTLPVPKQKDENNSIWSIMWSILKESLGKDLTHITLPLYFNEPLSVLQKSMEDLEYADLLNKVH